MVSRSHRLIGMPLSFALLGLALSQHAFAQVVPATRTPPAGAAAVPRISGHPRQIPCWEKVGVLPATMHQVTTIRESTQGQVATVCSDDSLSHDQKIDKIAGLKKTSKDQIDALIPAHQQEAIRSCQATRPHRTRRHRNPVNRSTDPCAYMLPKSAAAPTDSNQAEPLKDATPGAAAPAKPDDGKKPEDNPDDDATDPKN